MSAVVREAIRTAAEKVDGVSCTPYYRTTTKAGDAMVRLDRLTRASNGFGFMATWQVLLIMPQGLEAAEKSAETKIPSLIEALSEELIITSVQPQQIVLDQGTVLPVLLIEGNREADY